MTPEARERLAGLSQRLRETAAHQREQGGSYLDYGTPEPWLLPSADAVDAALTALSEAERDIAELREGLEGAYDTLGEQRRRCIRWEKSHAEIDGTMANVEALLSRRAG